MQHSSGLKEIINMKKLLIVLALIIGTSVSAQKKVRIQNINVEGLGDDIKITFNTVRASQVFLKRKMKTLAMMHWKKYP